MSKPLSSSSSRRLLSWADLVAAMLLLSGSALLPSPVSAQAAGGYGQRPNGPAASYAQPYMPSWASPQQTPSWATSQRPSWATTQTPSWAQMPSSNYRRQSPVFTPNSVTSAPSFTRPLAPPDAPSTAEGFLYPGVNYKRRVAAPSPSSAFINPPSGSGSTRWPVPENRLNNVEQNRGTSVSDVPQASYRVTTPIGERTMPARDYNNYVYNAPITYGGPALLGGYYYGNYCSVRYDTNCYPSVYGAYYGLPQFIYNPGIVVVSEPYYPVYITSYQPFYVPVYQVTYNENSYYVGSEDRVQEVSQGGAPAKEAIKNAYPADSYQAAFADIQNAWLKNDPALIDRHLRDKETKLSVFVDSKYTYSLASGDFLQITRDAFGRLNTLSFDFTRLRKAENGDVTAFGKHVYRSSGASETGTDDVKVGDTVPFSTDGSQPYDKSSDPVLGVEKTIYVSYTLRQHDKDWYIIAVDSSTTDLVK